jgi:hypothetical protein
VREGRWRDIRPRIHFKFSQDFEQKLENFEHESCRKFENLHLSFMNCGA